MRIGFLPLLLIVATYTLIFIYFVALVVVTDPQTVPSQEFVQQSIWLNVIVIPIQLLVSTMFIVGVRRLVVLCEKPTGFFYVRFQREEVKYFIVGLVIALPFYALSGVITVIAYSFGPAEGPASAEISPILQVAYVAYFIVFIFMIWPLVRFSLAFPHAAVAGEIDFGLSWRVMKDNFWRFILVLFIAFIFILLVYIIFGLLIVAFSLLSSAISTAAPPGTIQKDMPLWAFINFAPTLILFIILLGFIQAVSVTILSFSYKALILRNYETAA